MKIIEEKGYTSYFYLFHEKLTPICYRQKIIDRYVFLYVRKYLVWYTKFFNGNKIVYPKKKISKKKTIYHNDDDKFQGKKRKTITIQ